MTVSIRLFRGSARILAAEALALPCTLALLAFLARKLGPGLFGLYVLAVAVINWMEWTLNTMFSRASIKLVGDQSEGHRIERTVLQLYTLTALLFSTLLLLTSNFISRKLGEPNLAVILRLFAFDIPLWSAGQAYRSILVAREAFGKRAWLSATRSVSRMIFTIVFVSFSPTVEAAVIGWIAASVCEFVLALRFAFIPFWKSASLQFLGELLTYAAPLSLLGLILRFYDKLDLFILKWLGASTEVAGIFGAAQNASRGLGLLSLALAPPLLATVTRLLKMQENREASKLIHTTFRAMMLLIPFLVFGVAVSPELIRLFFGKEYISAIPLMAPLLYSSFFLLLISIDNSILTAAGRPSLALLLTFPILPIAITGHLLIIPIYGAQGAAVVSLIAAAVVAFTNTTAIYVTREVAFPAITFIRSAVISSLIWLILGRWHPSGWMIAAKIFAGCITIPGALWLSGEFRQKDLASIRLLLGASNA